MALKRNFQPLDTFSMSSMTDIIFLLLIFFMVTSTFIFPAAIDVSLPTGSAQTSSKPVTEIYLDADSRLFLVADNRKVEQSFPDPVTLRQLEASLLLMQHNDSLRSVALYADSLVPYAKVVDIMEMAARNNIRLVLATQSSHRSEAPVENETFSLPLPVP